MHGHTLGGSFLNQTHLATKKPCCLVLHESWERTCLHNLISVDLFPVISAQCLFIASCFIRYLIIKAVECFGFNLELFHIALECKCSSSLWLIKAVVSFLGLCRSCSCIVLETCIVVLVKQSWTIHLYPCAFWSISSKSNLKHCSSPINYSSQIWVLHSVLSLSLQHFKSNLLSNNNNWVIHTRLIVG